MFFLQRPGTEMYQVALILSLVAFCLAQPYGVFNVKDYGAKGDGKTSDTVACKAALAAAAKAANGSRVLFPSPGTYLTGSLNISSRTELWVEPGATVQGIRDKGEYPLLPPLPSYGSSRDRGQHLRYQALIGSYFADSVKVGGGGTIDGSGDYWWSSRDSLKAGRPRLVEFYNSSNVEISNVVLSNSGFWTLHPVYCRGVYIHDLSIEAPHDSPNTDGIDPDSSRDVLVERCSVSGGDDYIAIKSGLNEAGREVGLPSANVTVRDCVFGAGHGISIGSETSGGIADIVIENNQIKGPAKHGLNVKTAPARGGVITDLIFRNNTLNGVQGAGLNVGMNYDSSPPAPHLPVVSSIQYQSISGSGIDTCGDFDCLSDSPCTGITVDSVHLDCKHGWQCSHVKQYSVNDVSPTGLSNCFEHS